MKVKDLIEKLSKKDEDSDVLVNWQDIEYIFERKSMKHEEDNFIDITWDENCDRVNYWN